MHSRHFRGSVAIAAASVGCALILSACSSSGGSGNSGGGGQTSGSAGASTAAATGSTIKLGSVLTITNPAWNNQSVKDVDDAWVKNVNATGGINGHPISITTCDDKGDPATTNQCVANLLSDGVVAFVNISSLVFGSNALPTVERAGVAVIGGWPITPAEFNSPVEFPSTPGAAGSYPALVSAFTAMGKKKVAILYQSVSTNEALSQSLIAQWKKDGGTEGKGFGFDPTAPDYAPVMSTVKNYQPDAVIALVGAAAAPRLFKAAQLVGLKSIFGTTATDATKAVAQAAGSAMNGIYFATPVLPADTDSQAGSTYRSIMSKYAPGVELDAQAGVAASSVQYAVDTLSAIKGDITRASVLAQLKQGNPWPGFLSHSLSPKFAPTRFSQLWNPYSIVEQYENGKYTPVNAPSSSGNVSTEQGQSWFVIPSS